MRHAVCLVAVCVALASSLLSPSSAGAQAGSPSPRGAFGTYGERLQLGLEQIHEGDLAGALSTLEEAEKLSPAAPLSHCYRAAAQLALRQWELAMRSYGVCRTLAKQVKDQHAFEVALVGLARVVELSGQDVEAARTAYAEVVKEASSTAAKMLGAAKVRAYMALKECAEAAQRVRERSEQRAQTRGEGQP